MVTRKKIQFVSNKPAPLSFSTKKGKMIFISGLIPVDAEGYLVGETIQEQTDQVLYNVKQELEKHGASMADVVKTTVLLTNAAEHWRGMNEAYSAHFPDPKPSRSAYGVVLAAEGLLVEIEAIAIVE